MTSILTYEAELAAALNAVREAAKICRAVQASMTVSSLEKPDQSPVTIADYGSQAIVCRTISRAFPHDPMVAEEDAGELRILDNAPFLHQIHEQICRECLEASPDEICRWIDHGGCDDFSNRFWTLDPIDGTKGFLRKEQYAISLALIVNGEIALGVLGCPNLGETGTGAVPESGGTLYYAVRGGGAFVGPLDESADGRHFRRLSVSTTADGSAARLCESLEQGQKKESKTSILARQLGISQTPLRLDSQAKYAVVARGEADAYLRLPTSETYRECIWDHAGGVIVVEEAGGTVTDIDGSPLDFTHGRKLEQNRGVVVSNGVLHAELLEAIRKAGI